MPKQNMYTLNSSSVFFYGKMCPCKTNIINERIKDNNEN